MIQGTLRQWREAKQAALHQEERSGGAEVSPTEVSALGKSLQVEAEGNREAPPGGSVLPRQCAIETMQEILECIHALRLQTTHKMGRVRELDRTLACTLMAEFTRLQLVVGWDLTKSLIALQINLETSSEVFLLDFAKALNLHPTDPTSHQLKAILQGFQQATSLRVNLPLMELQVAWEDMEGFLQCHLQEISSQAKTQELVEGLPIKMSAHASRVWDLVSIPESTQDWQRINPLRPTSSWASWKVWLGGSGWCLQVRPIYLLQLEWVCHTNGQPPSERLSRRWR